MKEVGLFCVHGFMEDGQTTFRYFAEFLKNNGIYDYYLTNLQGHGLGENINHFNYRKCIEQVEKEFIEYKENYKKVFIIGFSMGGVIASYLASKFGADKLVLISPAFKYGQGSQVLKDLIHMVSNEDFPKLGELLKADHEGRVNKVQNFINNEYKDKGSSYVNFVDRISKVTVGPFINFTRLVSRLKKKIDLDIPVRIYHAEFDELVPLQSSVFIFKKIHSNDKRLVLLSGVGHRILSSNYKSLIFEEIYDFLYGDIEKESLVYVA
ncbi:alpha/beta fold hydrolase [Mycoplasmatota bacterium]|nr:alpha/beta fold hydrolase [Mycoplasmatota bacterium]